VALLLVAATVVGACGDDDGDDAGAGGSATTQSSTAGGDTTAGASTTAAEDVDPDGVLRVGVDLAASGGLKFDPIKMATGQYIYSTPVLRSLLMRDETGALVPDLAESAEVVDPTTVTATLRPNLRFSDGTPLDAAAVKATVERNIASNNSAGLQVADLALIESVTADSPTELTITMKQPAAAVAYALLAGVEFAPVSPATYAAAATGDGTTVVGAGPMMIESYTPNASVKMVRNPNYHDPDSVTLGGIEYVNSQPGPSMVNALRSGAIDYVVVTTDQSNGLTSGYEVDQHTMTAGMTFQWCMQEGQPLGNAQVRQAISYAIDREAYNEAIYAGRSEVAWDLWPESSPWHDPSLEGVYERDVAKARQLLAEGGYPDGFSFTMMVTPATTRDMEVLQAQLAEIGVEMQLIATTNPLDYYVDKKMDATYSQSRPGLDKLPRFYLSNSFSNVCKFPSPQADALYAQITALAPDDPEAIELQRQFSQLVVRDLAWFPMTVFQQHIVAYDGERVGELDFYYDQLGGRQPDPIGTTIRQG